MQFAEPIGIGFWTAGKVNSPVRPDPPDRDPCVDNTHRHVSRLLAKVGDENVDVDDAFIAKGSPIPIKPSQREIDEHELTHLPFRSWCAHCVRARTMEDKHRNGVCTSYLMLWVFMFMM